jgi:hypothetical protein
MAVALWPLRAFFLQMDVPTSQSYTMAVVARAEQTDGQRDDREPKRRDRGRTVGGDRALERTRPRRHVPGGGTPCRPPPGFTILYVGHERP